MPNKFKSISEIIHKEKAFNKVIEKSRQQEVIDKFHVIFPELKKIVEVIRVDKEILFLRVENSVWRSELNLKQNAIIKKIKIKLENIDIEKIKFIS